MSRRNEPDAQRAVEPALEPGEQLLTMLSATVSNWGDGGGYYIVWPVVTLLRVLNRRRRARAAGRSQGLRLRPAFIVAVTSQRVLFFAARRGWRPGAPCGELSRDRITGVMVGKAVLAGYPPRELCYIVVCMSSGPDLSLRVAAESAWWLRDEFGAAERSR